MTMRFYDQTHNKAGRVELKLIQGTSNNQITWNLYQVEEVRFRNSSPPNFSVPTAITLTRQ